MSSVVPSLVVETINALFPGPSRGVGTASLDHERLFHLQGVADLVRQIPDHLLTVSARDRASMTVAIAAIGLTISRYVAKQWPIALMPVSGEDVIHTIRRVLEQCPDEALAPDTKDLGFVNDREERDSLRLDISAANTALQNSEWKAATILGGAAIEALLHWRLTGTSTTRDEISEAVEEAKQSGRVQSDLKMDVNRWGLEPFLVVSLELGIITQRAFDQASVAREYRNLIHPGLAARRKISADRATALAVISGLEHVIRDLSKQA